MRRCHGFDLLDDGRARVNLINHGEKARQLGFVTGQGLELVDEVIATLCCQKRQLVHFRTVALLGQLERVLLQVECAQKLVDWQAWQVLLVDLNVL